MFNILASFGIGYLSQAHCGDLVPCRPGLTFKGRPFKLSLCIHSTSISALDGESITASQRPFVTVAVANKVKQTELGDWSAVDGQWKFFGEILTMEASQEDEICISVVCNRQVDLLVAALALSSRCVGEVCVPIASILPQLNLEDRDIDGLVYATPSINFDLMQDGIKTGRVSLSFETKNPPSAAGSGAQTGHPRCSACCFAG